MGHACILLSSVGPEPAAASEHPHSFYPKLYPNGIFHDFANAH